MQKTVPMYGLKTKNDGFSVVFFVCGKERWAVGDACFTVAVKFLQSKSEVAMQ